MSQSARPDIARVGFLTCRIGGNPLGVLGTGLATQKAAGVDLSVSLLTLPEAFNIIGAYGGNAHDRTIFGALVNLSKSFEVAFVVGLMDGPSPTTRINTAWLIDGDTHHLLAQKACQDSLGSYIPMRHADPKEHRGVTIAALICMDAAMEPNERCPEKLSIHADIRRSLEAAEGPTVLCIPAHSTNALDGPAKAWAEEFTAVVVSDSYNPGNVIYTKRTTRLPESSGPIDDGFVGLAELTAM